MTKETTKTLPPAYDPIYLVFRQDKGAWKLEISTNDGADARRVAKDFAALHHAKVWVVELLAEAEGRFYDYEAERAAYILNPAI